MITKEQIQFKKGKIGASQVAAAIGLSPFQTEANLAMELLGRIESPEENAFMRIGNIIEPAIAKIYMDQEQIEIFPWEETCVHPTFEWLIAHPDYYYNGIEGWRDDGKPICLIEIKNVGARQRFRWEDGVPVHVVAQVVLQSVLTGINRVEVVAYFGGNDLEIYPLTITSKQQESLLTKVSLFWFDWIEKNEIPPVCDRDIELIKTLYPSADNVTERTATPAIMEDVKSYQEWKTNRNSIDQTIGTLEAKIRLMMGGASTLKAPDGTRLFTWRQARFSTKTDWKEVVGVLKESFSELGSFIDETVKQHSKTKEGSRRFLDKHNYEA